MIPPTRKEKKMRLGNKSVLIKDHPLGKLVAEIWDRELISRGYPITVNVCSLPQETYDEIATIIDRESETFFEPFCPWEFENLRNAWNYQARHKKGTHHA